MPKPLLTKREEALSQIEHAHAAVTKALSLLGGRTRNKPKHGPSRSFIARQYLESIDSRLRVTSDLITLGDGISPCSISNSSAR